MNLAHPRLHLGCGSHILPQWINLDGQAGPGVDVVCDIHGGLWQLPSESLDWIYSSHVIEHLYPDRLPEVLGHLYRALRPGGRLTLATTDFRGIYEHRYRHPDNGSAWEAALFGEVNHDDPPMAAHRNCFDYDKLVGLLVAAGFAAVRPWRTQDYPAIHALNDYARSCALVTCCAEGLK